MNALAHRVPATRLATFAAETSAGRAPRPADYRDALHDLGVMDPEAAHSIADEFAAAVITAIADGHPNPRLLAQHARTVLGAEFTRWCA